jgi:hypothetical protein
LWSGPEFDSFVTVKSVWEQDTGGTVDWQGSRDLPGELDAQIESGTPPDIAILPNVGLMHELADAGQLVALPSVMDMGQLQTDYAPAWIDLGSQLGELYGIFYKVTNKATGLVQPQGVRSCQLSRSLDLGRDDPSGRHDGCRRPNTVFRRRAESPRRWRLGAH